MNITALIHGFDKAIEGMQTLIKAMYKEEAPLSKKRLDELNAMRIGAVLALGLIRDHSYLSDALKKKLPTNEKMGDLLMVSHLIVQANKEKDWPDK